MPDAAGSPNTAAYLLRSSAAVTFRVTLKFNGEDDPTAFNVADGWSVAAASATFDQERPFPPEADMPDLDGTAYRYDGDNPSTDKPIPLTGGRASMAMLDNTGGVRRLFDLVLTFDGDAVTGTIEPWLIFTRAKYTSSVDGRSLSHDRSAGVV